MGRGSHDDRRGPGLIRLLPPDPDGIAAAVEALAAGRLVLHPTETVVSLAGDPYSEKPVAAARRLKGYARPRPFLCLVPDGGVARSLAAEWPETAARLAEAFWPGPLTLIVPAGPDAPAPVVDAGRLAMRPASDEVSRRLLATWRRPLFSTSANLKGDPPSVLVAEAARALAGAAGGSAIELGLLESPASPGGAPAAEPSTIVDVSRTPPRLVRSGAVPLDEILEIAPGTRG